MKIFVALFETTAEFLSCVRLDSNAGTGLVQARTKAHYSDGEEVILEIGFPGLPSRVLIRTTAVTPTVFRPDEQWFEILPGEDHKRDVLIAIATGRAKVSWERRRRRFPMRMSARLKTEGDAVVATETAEVGSGGMSFQSSEALPDGTHVVAVLDPGDGSAALQIPGVVVWNRELGEGAKTGVRFDDVTGEDCSRLRRLIRDVQLTGETLEPSVSPNDFRE